MTFSGLMSRCTRPASWIASQPGQELRRDLPRFAPAPVEPASSGCPSSVMPSMYSIDTSSWPSISTRSKTRQTLGEITSRADAHLLPQGLERPLVLEQLSAQRLERHVDTQLQIEGPPDLAHAAAAQERPDPVAVAQDLTRGERLARVGREWLLRRGARALQARREIRVQAPAHRLGRDPRSCDPETGWRRRRDTASMSAL